MARQFCFQLLASLVGCTAFAGLAQGQGPVTPGGRPPVSPYLNLLRSGNPTYLNYYGLVRPQVDAQQSLQSLQGQILANNQYGGIGLDGQSLPTTGRGFGYFTHRSYFLNNRGGGGGYGGGYGGGSGASFGNNRTFSQNTGSLVSPPQTSSLPR